HETNSMVEDPCLQPAVTAATQGLLLPSPIGAETRWTWRRLPPRELPKFGAGACTRDATAADLIDCSVSLAGVSGSVQIGSRTWSCVHLRIAAAEAQGTAVQPLWFARGVGLVRSTAQPADEPETVRELVDYTPAPPLPDRGNVLSTAAGAAAAGATW